MSLLGEVSTSLKKPTDLQRTRVSRARRYAQNRDGAHVALLVKLRDAKLKVDIKSTDANLAAYVAAELPNIAFA